TALGWYSSYAEFRLYSKRLFTKPDAMAPNPQNTHPSSEERQMLRDRWKAPQRHLPPPQELERVQARLTSAALKGKAEFNRVWDAIFHGKYPSPGAQAYVKPGLRKSSDDPVPSSAPNPTER
ncbi:MAG: hypothetical protein ACREP1_13475, partial [Rhodanobacteraceae bacterium]